MTWYKNLRVYLTVCKLPQQGKWWNSYISGTHIPYIKEDNCESLDKKKKEVILERR